MRSRREKSLHLCVFAFEKSKKTSIRQKKTAFFLSLQLFFVTLQRKSEQHGVSMTYTDTFSRMYPGTSTINF